MPTTICDGTLSNEKTKQISGSYLFKLKKKSRTSVMSAFDQCDDTDSELEKKKSSFLVRSGEIFTMFESHCNARIPIKELAMPQTSIYTLQQQSIPFTLPAWETKNGTHFSVKFIENRERSYPLLRLSNEYKRIKILIDPKRAYYSFFDHETSGPKEQTKRQVKKQTSLTTTITLKPSHALLKTSANSCDEYEPLVISFALYDGAKKQKLSEDYYTEINKETIMKKCNLHHNLEPLETPEATFILPSNKKEDLRNLFIVLKAFRINSGDIEKDLGYYRKNDLHSLGKISEDVKKRVNLYPECLPLQPYFWNCFRLSDAQGEIHSEIKSDTSYLYKEGFSDDTIFDTIAGKAKNLKLVSTEIDYTTYQSTYNERYISPNNVIDEPQSVGNSQNKSVPLKLGGKTIMNEFFSMNQINVSFTNVLYIYPEFISTGTTSDIFIKFKLTKHDDLMHKSLNGLRCHDRPLFRGNSCNTESYTEEVCTSVHHCEKSCNLGWDEVKIPIPLQFSSYYLVVIVMRVDAHNGKQSAIGGFAMNLGETSFLADQSYCFSFSEQIQHTFPLQDKESSSKSHKKIFKFRTRLASTVIPLSNDLDGFFAINNSGNNSFKNTLLDYNKSITCTDSELIAFFPEIVRVLLRACVNEQSTKRRKEAFLMIFRVLKQITRQEVVKDTNMLTKYLDTLYDPEEFKCNKNEKAGSCTAEESAGIPSLRSSSDFSEPEAESHTTVKSVHLALIHCWEDCIAGSGPSVPEIETCQSLWFVLGLIEKSLAVEITKESEASGERKLLRLPESCRVAKVVEYVLQTIRDSIASSSICFYSYGVDDTAKIISKLLLLTERGPIYEVLHKFLSNIFLNQELFNAVEIHEVIILKLFSALLNNRFAVQLNSPFENYDKSVDITSENVIEEYSKAYPLCGLLLRYLAAVIPKISDKCNTTFKIGAENAIALLKHFLTVVSLDAHLIGQSTQEAIVFMLFPYFDLFVTHYATLISGSKVSNPHDFVLCFAYILKFTSNETLLKWWDAANSTQRLNFLVVLKEITPFMFVKIEDAKIAVRVFRLLLEHRKSDFENDSVSLLESLISGILLLLLNTERPFIAVVFPLIDILLENYITMLFEAPELKELYEDIIFNLFTCMSYKEKETYRQAAMLLYEAVEYALMIGRPEDELTPLISIAAERLNGENVNITDVMGKALSHAMKERDNELAGNKDPKVQQCADTVKKIFQHLLTRMKNYDKYSKIENEETIYAAYLNTAEHYKDSLPLQITWIENLYGKLLAAKKTPKFTEAAQCQIHLAYIYLNYLSQKEETRIYLPLLEQIAPNIGTHLAPKLSNNKPSNATIEITDFTIVQLLQDAFEFFAHDGEYLMAIRTANCISELCLQRGLTEVMLENAKLAASITAEYCEKERKSVVLFPKYFRVAFYAGENVKTALKEIDGKKFIYKKRPNDGLKGMTDEMVAFLREPFKDTDQKCEPVLVPNTATEVAPGPDQVMFQLAFVEPYCTDKSKRTQSEQYWGVNVFVNEQGITEQEGSSLRYQKKKRTFYTTEYKTPFVVNRFPIVEERSVIVTPIENAIDMIVGHSNRLIMQMERTPKQNLMQQVLQGIIMPMVNEGIPKVCEMFLEEQSTDPDMTEFQDKLSFEMCRLMNLTGYGLQFFRSKFANSACRALHDVLLQKFAELRKNVQHYLKSDHKIFSTEEFNSWEHYVKLTTGIN